MPINCGQVAAVVIGTGGGIFGSGHTVAVLFRSVQWRMTKPGNNGGNATTGSAAGGNNGSGNKTPAAAILPEATKVSLKNAPVINVNGR